MNSSPMTIISHFLKREETMVQLQEVELTCIKGLVAITLAPTARLYANGTCELTQASLGTYPCGGRRNGSDIKLLETPLKLVVMHGKARSKEKFIQAGANTFMFDSLSGRTSLGVILDHIQELCHKGPKRALQIQKIGGLYDLAKYGFNRRY
ncbi:hypothetical protein VNO77_23700 [Canavalia gladiata]|uniref:Uncharacterized protein n=1 Tax=Canavalia gladiata TaxID=3824 RepID=A0AAN9L4W0_CANGL